MTRPTFEQIEARAKDDQCAIRGTEVMKHSPELIEATARAIMFQDCGSDEDWQENIDLAQAALDAVYQRIRDAVIEDEGYEWFEVSKIKPPLHMGVLVMQREGVGEVCDVACYFGEIDMELGHESRWIMADIRLSSKQLTHWCYIKTPRAIRARKTKEIK